MIILSCSNISKTYLVDKILDDITFAINDGEKIGLIGLNGAGKTTLFKILSQEISFDSGSIYVPKNCKIGYLQQNTKIISENSVFEEALEVFNHVIEMEKRLRDLEHRISKENQDSNDLDNLMNEYALLSDKFVQNNGYGYLSEIRGTLKGLGFDESEFDQPINQLSGGQKSRVILAKLLLQRPDVLLLDEPTNHLDIEAIDWLEKYIKEYSGACIIISHDRYFLDSTVNKVFQLQNSNLKIYNGNYSEYMKKRKEELISEQRKYEKQQNDIAKQEDIIRRFMDYRGKRYIRQAKSRQKMLDKMKKLDKPMADRKKAKIVFEPKIKSGNDVLIVEDLEKYFDDFLLFKNINFKIFKGERVGIIGPNGIGKSTLFKIILGETPYSSGTFKIGHHVNVGYFDQEQSNLNDENTVVDEIWDENPTFDHYDIRTILAQFLFTGDDIFKDISSLSGGERSRIALIKLMLSKSNFLLMDEPTNHLDIDSKEVLEDALLNYSGTLLVVSHDRYFLNKVTDKILDLSKDNITEYLGNYDYYLEKKNSLLKNNDDVETTEKTKTQMKQERRLEKEKQKEKKKIKTLIKNTEEDISKNEKLLSELEKEMCLEEIYSNPEKSKETHDKILNIKIELEHLYDKWVELTE